MANTRKKYTQVLRIADLLAGDQGSRVIGRISIHEDSIHLMDWSGEITLSLSSDIDVPGHLQLVELEGRMLQESFSVEAIRALCSAPEPKLLSKASELGGPERILLGAPPKMIATARASLLTFTRSYFQNQGYRELIVPALMQESTTDPNISLFETRYQPLAGAGSSGRLFLQTSPELALKRALVSGAKAVFSATNVFRNGEADSTHSPEFLMLEWYRVGSSLDDLMDETEAFVRALFKEAESLGFQAKKALPHTFARHQLPEFYQNVTGVDLLESFEGDELAKKLEEQGLGPYPEDADYEEVFHQSIVERIQNTLEALPATFLYDYPAPLALLSRLDPQDSRIAKRVEAYLGSVEIANGFEELTQASEYRKRFEMDLKTRSERGLASAPIPESFLASMELGMPDCSGIAVGLDRLFQLACGVDNLQDIQAFRVPE